MTRDEVLALLAQHQTELAAFGLRRLALFGSVARNEAGPDSDIDVLVEFEGDITFRRYAGLYDFLEEVLGRNVDMATLDMIRPAIREGVERDTYELACLHPASLLSTL